MIDRQGWRLEDDGHARVACLLFSDGASGDERYTRLAQLHPVRARGPREQHADASSCGISHLGLDLVVQMSYQCAVTDPRIRRRLAHEHGMA